MSKAIIYKEIFETNALVVKDFISHSEKPYTLNFSRTLGSSTLFDNITLHIENVIKIISFIRISVPTFMINYSFWSN